MQSLKSLLSHGVFGIRCSSDFPLLQRIKTETPWVDLQNCELECEGDHQFRIRVDPPPNILLLEVDPTRSIDFMQTYIRQWRSLNLPIIWLIEVEINQQSLSHPIYYQLTQNISEAGECILDRNSISVYSIITIAESLLGPQTPG